MRATHLELDPLALTVIGVPAPQGSKTVYRGRPVESSKLVRPWRDAVAWSARSAMNRAHHHGFLTGPVSLEARFRMPRPKTLPTRRPSWPWHRPDLDKIVRATLDALVDAGVLGDDSQVVTMLVGKVYAAPGEASGVDMLIVRGPAAPHAVRGGGE